MEVSQAIEFHLQYHRANSKKKQSKPVSSSSPVTLISMLSLLMEM